MDNRISGYMTEAIKVAVGEKVTAYESKMEIAAEEEGSEQAPTYIDAGANTIMLTKFANEIANGGFILSFQLVNTSGEPIKKVSACNGQSYSGHI